MYSYFCWSKNVRVHVRFGTACAVKKTCACQIAGTSILVMFACKSCEARPLNFATKIPRFVVRGSEGHIAEKMMGGSGRPGIAVAQRKMTPVDPTSRQPMKHVPR